MAKVVMFLLNRVLLLTSLALPLTLGAESPLEEIGRSAVGKLKLTPKVDGHVTAEEWDSIPELGPFSEKDDRPVKIAATTVRVAQTEDALCFAIKCEEPDESGFEVKDRYRNERIWEDNGLELFIQPPNAEGYGHLAINLVGAKFAQWFGGNDGKAMWSPHVQFQSRKVAGGWTAEILIPFASIPGSRNGDWRFNVCRNRFTVDGVEYSALSPTHGSFQNPEAFHELSEVLVPSGLKSTELSVPGAKRGPQGIEVNFSKTAGEGFSHEAVFEDVAGRVVAEVACGDAYPENLEFPNAAQAAFWRMLLRDEAGNIFAISETAPVVDVKPLNVSILQPFYDRETVAEVDWAVDADFQNSLQGLHFEVSDGSAVVMEGDVEVALSGQWKMPIGDLKPGTYEIRLVASGPDGKEVRSPAAKLGKLPSDSRGTIVTWGKDQVLTVDGEPYFAMCLYRVPVEQWGTWLPGTGLNTVHAFPVGAGRHRKTEGGAIEWTTPLSDIERDLDAAARLNLKVILDVGNYVKDIFKIMPGEENGRRLREVVSRFRRHPALLGYYLIDEPYERNVTTTLEAREIIRELDPYHPTIAPSLDGDSTMSPRLN